MMRLVQLRRLSDTGIALPADQRFFQNMISYLHTENITTRYYNIETNETRDQVRY